MESSVGMNILNTSSQPKWSVVLDVPKRNASDDQLKAPCAFVCPDLPVYFADSKLPELPPSSDIMKVLIEKKKKQKPEEELTTLTSIAVCFKDTLNIKIGMPGVSKEEVRVSVNNNMVVIKGSDEEAAGGEIAEMEIELNKVDENIEIIKAEMKNGLLVLVFVPNPNKKIAIEIKVDYWRDD